jgi:hypothetical protein
MEPSSISARDVLAVIDGIARGASLEAAPGSRWAPVVRAALERLESPFPQPWARRYFGPLPDPWGARMWEAAYGPHPEPWSVLFASALAAELVGYAGLMQETSDAAGQGGDGAVRHVRSFLEEICGNDFRFIRLFVHPHRGGGEPPPRPNWLAEPLGLPEFAAMALQFHRARPANAALRETFSVAATRLVEIALQRSPARAA